MQEPASLAFAGSNIQSALTLGWVGGQHRGRVMCQPGGCARKDGSFLINATAGVWQSTAARKRVVRLACHLSCKSGIYQSHKSLYKKMSHS